MVNFFDQQPEIPDADYDVWDDSAQIVTIDAETQSVAPCGFSRAGDKEGIVPLGIDRGCYYYLSMSTGQVEVLTAAQHSRAMLGHLASESRYWERQDIFMTKGGVNWNAAADHLRSECRRVGIFDPDRLRGRGAWLDGDRSVLHVGDHAIVDGVPMDLLVPGSRYVYEHSTRMDVGLGEPLSDADANMLRALCNAAPWEEPAHMGQLLAGWCVIAPICGAMPWRPHLWITSEAGNGKSWVLDNIVKPIVGPVALHVQSKTTEPGIRQKLGCDARPVIFDEAETQNDRDRDRVQLVLDLARQASSEDGAAIIKGSSSGKAMEYRIRSCFVFSSINVGMSQTADESRTVVLTLALDPDKEKRRAAFAALQAIHAQTMTPGFAGRLLARTLSLLPVIRKNAGIFADAIARSGQSRRTGDTYGVLLAGAWSLRSKLVATAEQADKMVAETQWVKDAVAKVAVSPDWEKALASLTQYRTRVRGEDVPVGELIQICAGGDIADDGPSYGDAKKELDRLGMRVGNVEGVGSCLMIANHSVACDAIFSHTAWANSWSKTLLRVPGAKKNAANIRLAGSQTKVMAFPLSAVAVVRH